MTRSGIERIVEEGAGGVRGRVALLAHGASVDRNLVHSAHRLACAPGVRLTALFGPEHGIWGEAQDHVGVDGGQDPMLGLPVHSLYGSHEGSLSPEPGTLEGTECLVVDLQDVGARYYTFAATMGLAMEACGRAGVRVVIADRPNPIGGLAVEGNLPDAAFRSFVGLYPLAVRHGLTIGEIALYIRGECGVGCEIEVVPMEGWRRRMWFEETGLPWVLPSPNMPTLDTATVYPGTCLVEGTNLSEGRGTTRPFEIVGAPYVDGERLAERLGRLRLPGVRFRPLSFRPTFHKWAGQRCGGVQLHVTDRDAFLPFGTGIALVAAVRDLWPAQFAWRTEPYEFVSDRLAFDLLCGTDRIRLAVEQGRAIEEIEASWAGDLARFGEARARHLLYG